MIIREVINQIVVTPQSNGPARVTLQQTEVVVAKMFGVVNINRGTGYQVSGEVPVGLVNGSNATFTTQYDFVPSSVQVFLNGILQKIIVDYQRIGTDTILFSASPNSGESILVNYLKA